MRREDSVERPPTSIIWKVPKSPSRLRAAVTRPGEEPDRNIGKLPDFM